MKKLISSYLLTFLSFSAFADTLLQDKMQIHGFASQGFIQTTDNNFFGDSENGSFDFTELGINASFQLSPKIRLASQLISRRAGEMYNGSLWLDYALADINLVQGDNFQLGAYLGRIKNPLGLYNDTRDVAHTRQGVFTPQTIYFDKVRNISMSSDGIQFYGDYQFENGTLLVQGGIGFPIPDKNIEIVYMGQDWEGSLDNNDLALIGRIMYEYNGGEWIFALSGASLELDFDATLSDSMIPLIGFNDGVLAIDYTIVSLQHNAEKWQFTGEMGIQKINFENFGGLFSTADAKPLGYSLEVVYKVTPTIQGFLRRELFYLDRDDKYGRNFEANLQTYSDNIARLSGNLIQIPILPSYSRYSKSWVIGGRWDIDKNWMARAEYHWIDGTAILSPRENDMTTAKQHWDMFALSLSYRF